MQDSLLRDDAVQMIRAQTCPICDRELPLQTADDQPETFPFCSDRCRQIDLLRWSQGRYAIVEPLDPEAVTDLDSEAANEFRDW